MSRQIDFLQTAAQNARRERAPLAAKLRPTRWDQFVGFDRFDESLKKTLSRGGNVPPSLILWGPPGSGKTTFARLLAESFECEFVEFSAVLGGVKEVREIVDRAAQTARSTLLFVDEIHRFNRGQQDAFLPHVENGTISLVGATTENPSFALNSALLSRVKVVVLPPLEIDDLKAVLLRAFEVTGLSGDGGAIDLLVNHAGGDARRLLNLVELLLRTYGTVTISAEQAAECLSKDHRYRYDATGEEHYNIISAFIKSLRGSDADAALYYAFRMLESGEPPEFIFRRMLIFASEDVGNADPRAVQIALTTWQAFERIGLPEGRIPLAQCITYLATAPKSNRSYAAMHKAIEAVKSFPHAPVPLKLRNAPTGLMASLGYGSEYRYPHNFEGGYLQDERYLPDALGEVQFYEPSDRGYEKTIRERKDWLKKDRI